MKNEIDKTVERIADYEPYSEAWQKEMLNFPKPLMIKMCAGFLQAKEVLLTKAKSDLATAKQGLERSEQAERDNVAMLQRELDRGGLRRWISAKLLPQVGVVRLWQTATGVMFVGTLSDDHRLVYLTDDDARYVRADLCVAHRSLPPNFRTKRDGYDLAQQTLAAIGKE